MQTRWGLLIGLAALLGAGCGGAGNERSDDGTAGSPELDSAPQSLTGNAFLVYSRKVKWAFLAPLNLGTDRSCYLAGVAGNLTHANFQGAPAFPGVLIDPHEDNFTEYGHGIHFWVDAGRDGFKMQGKALCLPGPYERLIHYINGSDPSRVLPYTPDIRCFLSEVSNREGKEFMHSDSYLYVFHDSEHWWLKGEGPASGSTMCRQVSKVRESHIKIKGPNTIRLMHNDTGKVRCALTGIGGAFTKDDWDDGVLIDYDEDTKDWLMSAGAGKSGEAECFE